MGKHLGRREREARKRKKRGGFAMQDFTGAVTLKLGRKKFMDSCRGRNRTAVLLKKKFRGCVVETER